MTMGRMSILPALAAVIMLSGCVQYELDPKWTQNVSAAEAVGALAGGAVGGFIGSQFGAGTGAAAMTGLGVVAGAALGREIGNTLERADHSITQQLTPPSDAHGGSCPLPLNGTTPVPGNSSVL